MIRKIFVLVIVVLISMSASLMAGDGEAGYAGAFMQVPIGARPTAMGSAYLAVSNDGAGPMFNPAGLPGLQSRLIGTSYRIMQLDRSLGYVNILLPTQGTSVLGFNWLYAGSGAVEARNSDGDPLGYELSKNDHVFSALFAKRFEKYLSVGFKASYLYSKFAEMSSFSIGLDFGMMFYYNGMLSREKQELASVKDIQFGMIVRNVAVNYRWNNEKYQEKYQTDVFGVEVENKPPVEFGLGISARFLDRKLLTAMDVLKNKEQAFRLNLGAEYKPAEQFYLRGGMADKSFTTGLGYLFKMGNQILAIDYAFSTDRVDEGSEHLFSFDLLF